MSALSMFQTLPLLIADSIAQHFVNNKKCTSSFLPHRPTVEEIALAKVAAKQWRIIHNISRYWRELSFGHFCKRATVKLNAETPDCLIVTFDDWPSELGETNDIQHYRYVKHVTFHFEGLLEELSRIFAVFADSWTDTMVFPNATKITMVLKRGERDVHLSSISESDVTALQRITGNMLKALPRFSRGSIEIRECEIIYMHNITRETFSKHGLHRILPAISTGSATWITKIESSTFIKKYPYLVSETSLTRLYYHYSYQGDKAVPVIVRNAPILDTLVLDSFLLGQLKEIMLDKENNPIVYPRLKNFEYRIMSLFGAGICQTITKGVSFPALERVKCEKLYVFHDDALFRGCGKTLKHLDMELHILAIKVLTEHGVVEKLRNLRSINLKFGYTSPLLQDENISLLQFALGLVSQSTRSLALCDYIDNYSITETIALYPNIQNLVHLNLGKVKLQLTEAIEMIHMLPNLEFFGYACAGLGSSSEYVQPKNMPKYVLKKYYPLSLRLKYCDINTSTNTPTRSLAIIAMLLAIACPRFTFAKVPDKVLAVYNSTIESAIKCKPYLEHSDRLRCLLR